MDSQPKWPFDEVVFNKMVFDKVSWIPANRAVLYGILQLQSIIKWCVDHWQGDSLKVSEKENAITMLGQNFFIIDLQDFFFR